jgi:hypothetical protein
MKNDVGANHDSPFLFQNKNFLKGDVLYAHFFYPVFYSLRRVTSGKKQQINSTRIIQNGSLAGRCAKSTRAVFPLFYTKLIEELNYFM